MFRYRWYIVEWFIVYLDAYQSLHNTPMISSMMHTFYANNHHAPPCCVLTRCPYRCLSPSISLLVSSYTKDMYTMQNSPHPTKTAHGCVLTGVDGDCTTGEDWSTPSKRLDFAREDQARRALMGEPRSVWTTCLPCSLPIDDDAVPRDFGWMVLWVLGAMWTVGWSEWFAVPLGGGGRDDDGMDCGSFLSSGW